MQLERAARIRYLRQSRTVRDSKQFMRRQMRVPGNPWGVDWSAVERNIAVQIELAHFIAGTVSPEAYAVLNTPFKLSIDGFRRRLRTWRTRSAWLHRHDCPPRTLRKLEYLAALEYGAHPRKAVVGRLHAHVLLYNLGSMRLGDLAQVWRELNYIKNEQEPLIQPYKPGIEGILYNLKSYGSEVDLIDFSPKFSHQFVEHGKESDSDSGHVVLV